MTFKSGTPNIDFNGGKQFISISVISLEEDRVDAIPAGIHPASDLLDTDFTIQFTLLSSKPYSSYTELAGDKITIFPIVLASDASSMGIITWLLTIVGKLLTFLLTLEWPVDANDIFLQPIQVIYKSIMTTYYISNKRLIVPLPLISIKDIKNNSQAGYTPFTLNFTCQDLVGVTNASRDI